MRIFLLIVSDLLVTAIGLAAGIFTLSPQIISKAYRALIVWYKPFDQFITADQYP